MYSSQRVWCRFERAMKDGSVKKFRIQEVPNEIYGDLWQFVKENFLKEEPLTSTIGILEDPEAIKSFENFWTKYVYPQNLSVLCIEDKEHTTIPEIVGVNNLLLCEKGNEKRPEGCSEPAKLLKTFQTLFDGFDVYKHFDTTKYLGAAGLSVNRKYRGMNIGLELLKAREFVCRHHGIKYTETIFTAPASQVLATKAGFYTIFEKSYEQLGKELNIKFSENLKMCKVMGMVYD